MPQPKRPLSESDANASAPPSKRNSKGSTSGKENATAVDYSSKTVSELSDLLKERSLPHSGKKAVLVERLIHSDGQGRESECTGDEDDLEFVCFCRPIDDIVKQKESEDDSYDPDDDDDIGRANGCGTDACMCGKPAAEHPSWKWVQSKAGGDAIVTLANECTKRDQDMQGQYHYNDFSGYGFQEAVENHLVLIDKELCKASPSPQKLWPLLEAIAMSLPGNEAPWFMSDISDDILDTLRMIGGAYLCTLKALKKNGLLKKDSPIRNIALVLMMIRDLVQGWPGGPEEEELSWVDAAMHKAAKNGVEFREAPFGIEEGVEDIDPDDEEEEYDTGIKWSTFNWKKEVRLAIRCFVSASANEY